MSRKRWTSEEKSFLRDAVAAGKELSEIAVALGRTLAAIRSAVTYLDQEARPPRRNWAPDEITYLHAALDAGNSAAEIATALGRSRSSVLSAARVQGRSAAQPQAFVPCQIGIFEILAAELPNRNRKVLTLCTSCGREKWLRLAGLQHRIKATGGYLCVVCWRLSRSPAPPRLKPGDVAGHFTVLEVLGQRSGGWQYSVRDNRCGHERMTAVDKPTQPFLGVLTMCGCPVRGMIDGYVTWAWYMPDGRRVLVMEHRIVMEQLLGRPLYDDENVHHVNGVKADNRPGNLELWVTSQPSGQRVEDKVTWAAQILARYAPEQLGQLVRDPRIVRALLGGLH